MVIILFDAAATTKDGQPYRNTYNWYFQMAEGNALNVTTFFDTPEFDEFWTRVPPTAQIGSRPNSWLSETSVRNR